jgi:hypothetical protein
MRQPNRGHTRRPGPISDVYYPPRWKLDLDKPKKQADPCDDEFDQGVLDPKWTVVDGSAGTCSLTYTGGDRYDVTSRKGWLLMQVDNGNHVKLRQDYTLPDGYSIVMACAPTTMADAQSGIANNEIHVGLALNDNDGDYPSGNAVYMYWDTGTDNWRIAYASQGGTSYSTPIAISAPIAHRVYFRIARVSLDYYGFWSGDGSTWMPLAKYTAAAELTNVWVFAESLAAFGDPTPIHAVDWMRQGGNGIDPW